MRGIMFNTSKSDTNRENCIPKYVIEADHLSGVETASSVGADTSKGRLCDLDQLIVRPDMLPKSVIRCSVV